MVENDVRFSGEEYSLIFQFQILIFIIQEGRTHVRF